MMRKIGDKCMKVWAGWLGLTMVLSVALAGCSNNSNNTTVTLSISPSSSTVLLGTSIQFIPSEAGSQNGIQWSVDGIANGNATVGTIDSTGLYTAPATVPSPATVAVTATSALATSPGTATVTILAATPIGTFSNIQVTATAAEGPAHADPVTLTVD